MDKNTLGPYPAAESLVKILNDVGNDGLTSSVSRRLSQYRDLLDKLEKNFSGRDLRYLSELVRDKVKETTMESDWPVEVKTHFNNVISSDFKKLLENS